MNAFPIFPIFILRRAAALDLAFFSVPSMLSASLSSVFILAHPLCGSPRYCASLHYLFSFNYQLSTIGVFSRSRFHG